MPPNKQLKTLRTLSTEDLSRLIDLQEGTSTTSTPSGVIEYSSRNNNLNKVSRIVEDTTTARPATTSSGVDSTNYWYWEASEAAQDNKTFSATYIERKLVTDAARRADAERAEQSANYWTWNSPAEANAAEKMEVEKESYWEWKSPDVLCTDHIVKNLVRDATMEDEHDDEDSNSVSDDYWSWENKKERINRHVRSKTKPLSALSGSAIEERLVRDSSSRGCVREEIVSEDNSYWKWDPSYISHSRSMKNKEKACLDTEEIVARLVRAGESSRSGKAAYWDWSNEDVLSLAAMERRLIEASRLANVDETYWAWEGCDAAFDAANVSQESRVTSMTAECQSYWVM